MKKYWKEWKSTAIIGLGIIVLALVLRLYNLDSLPVFVDEAIYIRWAQVMKAESTLRFLPLSDGKQPFFMWIVIPFLKVITDPIVAGRIPSVLTGIGTLIVIFTLTYYLFKNKKVALIASFVYAISPYAVFFDRIGLVDSMLSMFGVLTLFLAIVVARTKRLDFAMLTGFSLGFAGLTKSSAVFFAILLPITWFLVKWPKKIKDRWGHFLKLGVLLGVTYAIAFGMYNILRLGPNFHLIGMRNQDYVLPVSHLWTSPWDPFLPYIDRVLEWFWQMGPSMIVVFAAGGLVWGVLNKKKEILVLSIFSLVPVLVQSMYAKAFTARYVLFSLPTALIVAASLFLMHKIKGFSLKSSRAVLAGGLVIFTLHALWVDYLMLTNVEAAPLPRVMRSGYLEEWTAGTGIREVGEIVREEYLKDPETKIVVGTEGFFGTLPDGLQVYLNDLPEVTVIGVGLGIVDLPSQLSESREAGNKTYLVINSSRLLGDPVEMGLTVVAAYPKAFRPEGRYKEYVHYGPRDTLYLFEVTGEFLSRKSS